MSSDKDGWDYFSDIVKDGMDGAVKVSILTTGGNILDILRDISQNSQRY